MGWMKAGGKKLGAYATLGFDFYGLRFPFSSPSCPQIQASSFKGDTDLSDTRVISTEICVTSHQFQLTPALSFSSRRFFSLSASCSPLPPLSVLLPGYLQSFMLPDPPPRRNVGG